MISNRRQRLQILTLIPNLWSIRKAAAGFSVSKSTIQKGRQLRTDKGIVGYPDIAKRQRLSQELIDTVTAFYYDD